MRSHPSSSHWRHLLLALPVIALPVAISCAGLNQAPQILTQPGDLTVSVGESASFNVSVQSASTATYQWQRNGQDIPGATSQTYTLENAQGSDNNSKFAVVVSNTNGSVTSATATLTVKDAGPSIEKPVITEQPQNQAIKVGEKATFKVAGTGNPTFQWKRNGQDIPGATQNTYTLVNAQEGDNNAKFSAVLTNTAGSVTSQDATLTVQKPQDPVIAPEITNHPSDLKVETGKPFELKVTAKGTALTYQWRKDDQPIQAATSAIYSVKSAQESQSGSYDVVVSNTAGNVTSSKAYVNVYTTNGQAPSIVSHPQNLTVKEGASATFAVEASGNPAPSYQWRRNNEIIEGACDASFTLSNVKQSDSGASFDVLVSNTSGKAVSNAATLTVSAVSNATAPSFSLHPSDVSAKAGEKVTFKAKASGSPEPTYQWLRNGEPIANAVSESYTLTVKDADFGASFSAKASNTAGTVTSNAATIKKISSGGDNPSGQFTVTFESVGEGGTLEGELTQSVKSGQNCTSVKAVFPLVEVTPNPSFPNFKEKRHINWINFWVDQDNQIVGVQPELTLQNVQKNMTVKAVFTPLSPIKVGMQAANVVGVNNDGKTVSMADYKGKVILLDVFTGWCGACMESAPSVQAFHEKYKDSIVTLGIITQPKKPSSAAAKQADIQAWIDLCAAGNSSINMPPTQLTYPMQTDAKSLESNKSKDGVAEPCYIYKAEDSPFPGFPTYVVIDQNFKVIAHTTSHEKAQEAALKAAGLK